MTEQEWEAKAEIALIALRDQVNVVLDVAHLGGVMDERKRILEMLEDYFKLTQEPGDNGPEENPEWDRGFQAAIALIKGNLE